MDIKELKKLVKYARSVGITELTIDGTSFKLSTSDPTPERKVRKQLDKVADKVEERIDSMSDEDLLLWSSSTPIPEPKQDA